MVFSLKTIDFRSKIMNSAFKTMDFRSKIMNFGRAMLPDTIDHSEMLTGQFSIKESWFPIEEP